MQQLQVDQYVKEDISNAVNAGKVVTVSKSNVTVNGWNGCGYIISTPETGSSAYKISAGANGGWFDWVDFTHKLVWGGFFILGLLSSIFLPFWIGLFAAVLLSVFSSLAQILVDESWGVDSSMNSTAYGKNLVNLAYQAGCGKVLTEIITASAGVVGGAFGIYGSVVVVFMMIIDLFYNFAGKIFSIRYARRDKWEVLC